MIVILVVWSFVVLVSIETLKNHPMSAKFLEIISRTDYNEYVNILNPPGMILLGIFSLGIMNIAITLKVLLHLRFVEYSKKSKGVKLRWFRMNTDPEKRKFWY